MIPSMKVVKRRKMSARTFARDEPDDFEMELEESRGVQNPFSQSAPRGSSFYTHPHHQPDHPIAAPTSFHNPNSGLSRKRPRIAHEPSGHLISSSRSTPSSNSGGLSKSTIMIDLTGDHDARRPGDDNRPDDARTGDNESKSFLSLADMRDSLPPTSLQRSASESPSGRTLIHVHSSDSDSDTDLPASSDTLAGDLSAETTTDSDDMARKRDPKGKEKEVNDELVRKHCGMVWDDAVEVADTTTFNGHPGRGFRHIYSDSDPSEWVGKKWISGGPPGTSAAEKATEGASVNALISALCKGPQKAPKESTQKGPAKRSGAAKAKKKGEFAKKNKPPGSVPARPPKVAQSGASTETPFSMAAKNSSSSAATASNIMAGSSTSASAKIDPRFTGTWTMPTHSPTPGPSSSASAFDTQGPSSQATSSESESNDGSMPKTPVEEMRSVSITNADDVANDPELQTVLVASMETHADEKAKREHNFNMICEKWEQIQLETEAGTLGENISLNITSAAKLEEAVNAGLTAAAIVGGEQGTRLKMLIEKIKGRALEVLEENEIPELLLTQAHSSVDTPQRVATGATTGRATTGHAASQTTSPTGSNGNSDNDVEFVGETPRKRKHENHGKAKDTGDNTGNGNGNGNGSGSGSGSGAKANVIELD